MTNGIQTFTRSLKTARYINTFSSALGYSKTGAGLASAATVAKGALSGLWSVIAAHPIIATITAIAAVVTIIDKYTESAKELKERIEDVTTSYREQHDSLMKLKGDYDTSDADSMISKYEELSKGVNSLGENVSLTADEYSEYQSIVDTIASQNPDLVAGYNSQGDAILTCAGNIDKLVESYQNLIREQNKEVLDTGEDIFKDFKNDLANESKGVSHGDVIGGLKNLESILNAEDIESVVNNLSGSQAQQISKILEDYGIERDVLGSGKKGYENWQEHIINAVNSSKVEVKKILDEASADINAYAEDLGTVTDAYFSDAFLGDYAHLSERMQNIITQTTSGFDSEFYADFLEDENPYESLTNYFDSMLESFDNLSNTDAEKFEAAFDLQTQFNGGDITYGEYVKSLQEAGKIIDSLDLDEEVKTQIKLSLGLNEDGLVDEYENLIKRLSGTDDNNVRISDFEIDEDAAKEFLNGLSAEELSVATQVIPELSENGVWETVEDLKKAINREMAIQGLTFDLNLEFETESIDALNTAMAESVSATGLSSESISALKSRYADLESQGYDLSAMFEETSNGIHLNKKAVNELEKAYAKQKLDDINSDLSDLEKEYELLTNDINNCNDASERAALYVQRDAIAQQINDAATLAAQYEGLTSAYNAWLTAEESGSERDMYENIISGFETVEDEIKRGWLDDGTIEFLKLIRGEKATIVDADGVAKEIDIATASAKELKQVWKDLDKNIENTSYSVKDFFTVDEDGNSTSQGVYNFLDAVGQLEEEAFDGKDVVKRKNGKIIGFDFQIVGGDEAIAEALGISEELVQIMLRAADDAGFVVTLDGQYTQLADLKTAAEEANDTLKKLKNQGIKELKDTDLNFDFSANNLQDLNTQLEKATTVLDKFRNKDGTVNLEMDGAEEALEIASYFTATLDKLTEPVYMQLETNQVEKDLQEPLTQMQEFERLSKQKHQLTLSGDTKKLKKVEKEMQGIAEELKGLDKETKIKLGIDGLTTEEIKEKLEAGEIEIPATVDIQLEMSEDIRDMRMLMMNQLGLVSDNEVKLKIGYEIDDSLVDKLTDEEKEVVIKYIEENEDAWNNLSEEDKEVTIELLIENKDEFDDLEDEEKEVVVDLITDDKALQALENNQLEIEAFAHIAGVEKVDDLEKKLKGLDDEQILVVAEVIGNIKVNELKNAIGSLEDKDVEAIAKAIGEGDVIALRNAIFTLEDEEVEAIAKALGYEDVESLRGAMENLTNKDVQAIAQVLGITDVDSLRDAINRLTSKDVDAVANVSGKDDVDSLKNSITNLKGKTITVWASIKKKASNLWDKLTGGGGVDGTAHASGTAFADGTIKKSGRAFKQGDWGTKDSGIALGGEEAPELLVRNGRWHLIGEDGAEFFGYKKGDIIFNGDQTREIFEKGKITHGNGRGKALVSGTAFSSGTVDGVEPEVGSVTVGSSSKKSSSSSSSDKDKFEETFDWIERAIQKVERAIDRLDQKASRTWKSWSSRNSNLRKEISKIDEEIKLQGDAYDAYMAEANAVGLSSEYKKLVQSGKMDISTITDEETAEKIKKYQEYYDKAKECEDNLLDLQDDRMSKYMELFDNVISKYDGVLQGFDHTETMINEYISQAEARGHAVSKNYYKVLMQNEKDNIVSLEKKRQDLIKARDEWVAAGGDINSEDYFNMCAEIDATTQAIAEGETAILNYANSMREIDWSNFDLLQERISGVTDEANFLIDLMSNDKLYDDNGQLTDQGMATMGLHGQNYNTNMYQADLYAAEIERLNKQIAVDPYDQDLIDRRNELLGLQRESILAAEDEKQAMIDMVKEGIELELDALQERIDKYNEAMDSAKDLYDYQKKVKEQTEEIAKLEKQMAAYAGDDSEEAKAKVQELKVSLEEAKENLKETEYEKYISDQKALLDSLYLEYETVLNERLDNTDELLNQMIDGINNNADTIAETLASEAESVGTTLSEEMQNIWSAGGDESAKSVLTKYGDDFNNNLTTVNTTLGGIKTDIDRMISYLNGEANKDMKSDDTDTSANDDQSGNQNNGDKDKDKNKDKDKDKNKKKTIKKGGKIKATGAKIYDYKGDKSGERQYYRNDPIYKVLAIDGTWIKARYHKLSSGVTGWFKKSDVKAYKTGAKSINYDDMAWTQEGNKREFIVRPSDGAILTPVAKGDSVLNAAASSNIWNMANSPVDFIRDNLRLETSNIPSESSTQSSYTQYLDKVVFNLPNVKNYDELLSTMQKDKNFERLINSMTIDQIAGKSSLTKGKSIR